MKPNEERNEAAWARLDSGYICDNRRMKEEVAWAKSDTQETVQRRNGWKQ